MKTEFADVIEAWQNAEPDAIHPLRSKNIDDYWSSGVSQATDATEWIPEGGTILDFGCGDGRLTIPLALFGYKVIAADASEEMLHRVRANVLERTDGDLDITYLQTNGLDLQDGPQVADAVIARAVFIHHSHADVERLVQKLSTVLKPGGHLIADWPVGSPHERRDWIDVTVWTPAHRAEVAKSANLKIVSDGTPSVWVRV